MESFKVCSFQNCPVPPILICKCTQRPKAFCQKHIVLHNQQLGVQHRTFPIWIEITPDQQNILKQKKQQLLQKKNKDIRQASQKASKQYQELQKIASNIKQSTQQILQQIQNKYSKTLQNIEYYLSCFYFYADQKNTNTFTKLLNSTISTITSDQLGLTLPYISPSQIVRLHSSFVYFFKFNSKQFFKVDLKNLTTTSNQVDIRGNMGGDQVCWADEESLLFSASNFSNTRFRIDVDKLRIYPVPSFGFEARRGAVVKHKGNFFRFGYSSKGTRVHKWDGKSDEWNVVFHLPESTSFMSAVSVGECILVTGDDMEYVYAYYEELNRYKKVLRLDNGSHKHLLVASWGDVICLESRRSIRVCKISDIQNWRYFGTCNIYPRSTSVSG